MAPTGAFETRTRGAVIEVNGQRYQAEVGQAFDKAVHNQVQAVGFQGKFYVKVARAGNTSLEFITPDTAPAQVEEGMLIVVSPHSQGA